MMTNGSRADLGSPNRADATALPRPGEQLLWLWRPSARWMAGRPWIAGVAVMLIAVAASAYALWRLNDPDLPARYRRTNLFIVLFAVLTLVSGGLRLAGRHRSADSVEALMGEDVPVKAYGLTQHLLLMLARTRALEVPLEPGEPIIQYGKFRIDRPDRRGRTLIRSIPMDEQRRLFAALKEARSLRDGRELMA